MNQILDVGSGKLTRDHVYLKKENVIHVDINPTAFHIEVLCDICNLSFRDNYFKIVHASRILEHINNPLDAAKELERVSNKTVIIKVPNSSHFKYYSESSGHIYSWNYWTLKYFLQKLFPYVKIMLSQRFISIFNYSKPKKLVYYLKWYFWHHLSPYNELTAICKKELKT